MEKSIYFLSKGDDIEFSEFSAGLRGPILERLRDSGASQITLNIADLNEQISATSPGRLLGPWQHTSAVVSLWHDCIDRREPIERALIELSSHLDGYLVTESIPQSYVPEWEGGERRPGVTQFGANGKPDHVTDAEFYHNWQVLHSTSSFDLHPLRWSYVRNAVARPLTEGAPAYRAIVSEHFRELGDFTDDSRYFGSEQAVQTMLEEVPGFCDFNLMLSLGMSEYYFR